MKRRMPKKRRRVKSPPRPKTIGDIFKALFEGAPTATKAEIDRRDREAWDRACADVCAAFISKALRDDKDFVSPVPPATIVRNTKKHHLPHAKKLIAPYYAAAGGPCMKQGCQCRHHALLHVTAQMQRTMPPEKFFESARTIVVTYLANRS